MTDWISVDDRLPEDGEEVIILCYGSEPKGGYYIDEYTNHIYWSRGDSDGERCYDFTDITHWMPLPEPPHDD